MTIKAQRYLLGVPIPFTTIELTREEVAVIEFTGTHIAVNYRKVKAVDEDTLDYSIRDMSLPGIKFQTKRLWCQQITDEDIRTNHTIAPYRFRWESTLNNRSRR